METGLDKPDALVANVMIDCSHSIMVLGQILTLVKGPAPSRNFEN